MAIYKIHKMKKSNIVGEVDWDSPYRNCHRVGATRECFEVNGKHVVMEFDEKGHTTTTDEDVVEYYRNRNFPNSFPNGAIPHYWVYDSDGNLIVS